MKKNTYLPLLLIISLIACCIEIDISAPSFPEMAEYFAASDGMIQMTISSNFLGFCLASLIYGPASESLGRRKVMIYGNAIMLVGAIGCTIAPTLPILIFARFIQGFGAATSAVIVFAMVADVYKGSKATHLISVMNTIFSALIAIAPVAGSLITKFIGFRGNYGVVAFITLLSWLGLFFFLAETKQNFDRFSINKIKMDYKRLFTSTAFLTASLIPSIFYSASISYVACAPFLYMENFRLSIYEYGFHQAIIVTTFSITSIVSNKITKVLGEKNSIITSILLSLTGVLLFIILSLYPPFYPFLITVAMMIFSVGFAICYPIVFSVSLELFPEIKGTASSAIMSMRTCMCAGFVGITSLIYNGSPLSIAVVLLFAMILISIFIIIFLRHAQTFKQREHHDRKPFSKSENSAMNI